MKLVKNIFDPNLCTCPSHTKLAEVSSTVLSSRRALLCMLQTHASREYGIEGKDYRIAQAESFPFMYAKSLRWTGDSITFEL